MNYRDAAKICGETEKKLWNYIATAEPGARAPLVLSSKKRTQLLSLLARGPLVGVVPFNIHSFSALTAEAKNEGVGSLCEALMWCANQTSFPRDYVNPVGIEFSRSFLTGALEMAQISAVGASVIFGLDKQTARLMHLCKLDRWAIEVFLRHFTLQYELVGIQEELKEDFQDPVHSAFFTWLEATPKSRNVYRDIFLKKMFRLNGSADIIVLDADNEAEKTQKVWNTLKECYSLGTSFPTAKRIAELYGIDSNEAYKRARRVFRERNKERYGVCLPRGNKGVLLLQVCRSLMERSLRGTCSTSMLVEAWMWAALISVRIMRHDKVVCHEGIWLTLLGKQMRFYLSNLVSGKTNKGGEAKCRSAVNNQQGEEHVFS